MSRCSIKRAASFQHRTMSRLTKVIGSKLAPCLTGEADGLQLLSGNKINKQILEDMYENWPIFRKLTLLLRDFLMKAFSNSSGRGPFRILEIGARTGGTTQHIVNHLRGHGIPFEYTSLTWVHLWWLSPRSTSKVRKG